MRLIEICVDNFDKMWKTIPKSRMVETDLFYAGLNPILRYNISWNTKY